jgi:hypothetical protein
VNAPNADWVPIAEYYPGPQYADVVTMDIYGEFKQDFYTSMLTLAAGKPIALAEVGGLPTPEILDKQPRWTYFMCWSEIIRTSNSLEKVLAVYHAPRMVNRDDPRLAVPMAAIRKATTDLTGSVPSPNPVSPGASAEAEALLARLATPGQPILSGQENDPASPSAATAAVLQATGKQPSIYATELSPAVLSSGMQDARKAIVAEALRTHAAHGYVSLSWHPARPTDDAVATAKNLLTDYEWSDLLTPGTPLNQRWLQQVDSAAETLRELDKAGVAVLWNPLPESSGVNFWWAGRKGVRGSAELYRQLFDRLVNHDGLHNLVWVWEVGAPVFRPGDGPAGGALLCDCFPGYRYADALEIRLNQLSPRFPASRMLSQIALEKPIGAELAGDIPSPAALTQGGGLAWFLAAPLPLAPADSSTRTDALRKLYADPQIGSIAPTQ